MENEIATQLKETRSIVEMAVIWSRELERNGAKVTEGYF